MDIEYCDHLSILHVHILYHVCGRRHQCYSSLTEKDMTGELHNVDKSVQIETNYKNVEMLTCIGLRFSLSEEEERNTC